MRALVKRTERPGDVAVVDRPVPSPPHGHVLVRTEACGLCGSDVHAWKQDAGYDWVRAPVILGHEAVGIVVGVGTGVDERWVGRRVVPVSIDGCGQCLTCRRGLGQICPEKSVLGLSFDGAAAELFTITEERLVPVDVDLPASTLVLTEPLSVAYRAVSHLEHTSSVAKEVVVSGPGPIGLMAALLLSQRGYRVVLMGADRDRQQRLALASSLGLDTVVAGTDIDVHPHGWIEASGSSTALDAALRETVPGGTVIVPALFGGPVAPDVNLLTRREIHLQGSYGSRHLDYAHAMSTLAEDPHKWSSLVTTQCLSKGTHALDTAATAEIVKIALVP